MRAAWADTSRLTCIDTSECGFHDSSIRCLGLPSSVGPLCYKTAVIAQHRAITRVCEVLQFGDRRGRCLSVGMNPQNCGDSLRSSRLLKRRYPTTQCH